MAFSLSPSPNRAGLSALELRDISRTISRKFAPQYIRRQPAPARNALFSVQELLAVSEEISREYAPRAADDRAKLVLLPIDPQHVHVYWQLPHLPELSGGPERAERAERADAPGTPELSELPNDPELLESLASPPAIAAEPALTLRLFKQMDHLPLPAAVPDAQHWFDIAVKQAGLRKQVVKLPVEQAPACAYWVELGKKVGGMFIPLVSSNRAALPAPAVHGESGLQANLIQQSIMPVDFASSPTGKPITDQE